MGFRTNERAVKILERFFLAWRERQEKQLITEITAAIMVFSQQKAIQNVAVWLSNCCFYWVWDNETL